MGAGALILSLARRDRFGAFFPQWRKILALMAELYFRCWHKYGRGEEGGGRAAPGHGTSKGLSHEKDILLKTLIKIQDFLFVR